MAEIGARRARTELRPRVTLSAFFPILPGDFGQPCPPFELTEGAPGPHSKGVAAILPKQPMHSDIAALPQFLAKPHDEWEETRPTRKREKVRMEVGSRQSFQCQHLIELAVGLSVVRFDRLWCCRNDKATGVTQRGLEMEGPRTGENADSAGEGRPGVPVR